MRVKPYYTLFRQPNNIGFITVCNEHPRPLECKKKMENEIMIMYDYFRSRIRSYEHQLRIQQSYKQVIYIFNIAIQLYLDSRSSTGKRTFNSQMTMLLTYMSDAVKYRSELNELQSVIEKKTRTMISPNYNSPPIPNSP
jgi:hypothetical protein